MRDNIQKAIAGDQKAMQALYEQNKSKVLFLCQIFLVDENEADHATAYIFKKMWEDVIAERVAGESEFKQQIIKKTIMYCKNKIQNGNNRAFRIPKNSDFTINVCNIEKMSSIEEAERIILNNLPVFHRFIYVLHTVAEYSEKEIARIFNTNAKVISRALSVEKNNIERLASALKKQMKLNGTITVDHFHQKLIEKADSMQVSFSVDETVRLNIQNVCKPIQEKHKKKKIVTISVGAGILIVFILAGIFLMKKNVDDPVDLENPKTENLTSESDSVESEDTDSIENAETQRNVTCYADIEIENYGTVTVALDGNTAPKTVENFVSLAESGFYDGLTFHRIIEGFMMQGGDPNGDGTGGADQAIAGEFTDNGYENNMSHTRGAISMARSSDYDSASSQFFIVHEDSTTLDGQYAVFGYVTEGMEIVDSICESAEPTDDNGTIPSEEQPVIKSITIRDVTGDDLSDTE